MLCNQYDNTTGQYVSSFLPDADPRNEGRWLIPAFCTTVPVPEHTPLTWPFWRDGKWVLLPDYRGRKLYRTDTGEPAEMLFAGIMPDAVDLTTQPRPSTDYRWDGKAWEVDPAVLTKRKHDAAMAEFEMRMSKARAANAGKSDAYAAGLLDELGIALFKAWAAYQMDCVRVVESPDFPDKTSWPSEPDATAIAAQVKASERQAAVDTPLTTDKATGSDQAGKDTTPAQPVPDVALQPDVQKNGKTGN